MKQFFFLSGLSRSGSTLLGSLLNQNPEIYVSPTSPLLDLFCETELNLLNFKQNYTFDYDVVSKNIHKNIPYSFYEHIDKKIIIDKHRGWPKNINTAKNIITPNVKVICTYRPVQEVITSFIKLCNKDPDNIVDFRLKENGMQITNDNRALYIWNELTYDVYDSLRYGLKNHRECIHIVNYKNLVKNTQTELDKIYNFLNLPIYQHELQNIKNTCSEQKDEVWGFSGLHDVRPNIEYQSDDPENYLSKDILDYFKKYDEFLGL